MFAVVGVERLVHGHGVSVFVRCRIATRAPRVFVRRIDPFYGPSDTLPMSASNLTLGSLVKYNMPSAETDVLSTVVLEIGVRACPHGIAL